LIFDTGLQGENKFAREQPFNDSFTREQRRAYYAAASFTDAQV
jgi:hypothetical protein